jgi:hypothetical protein
VTLDCQNSSQVPADPTGTAGQEGDRG